MKNRHLYVVIAGAFVLLSATNLTTLYLYLTEKIQHHKTQNAAKTRNQKIQTEAQAAATNFRKDAQQRFMETIQVFQVAKEEQNQIRQQLMNALSQRGKSVQAFYANRAAGIGAALKIIQQDGQIFTLYNQYLQIAEGREQTLLDRAKPLGASLGVGAKAEQS